MQVTDFLTLAVQGLLLVALPVVIAAAFQHFRAMSQQIKLKMTEEQRQSIDNAIKTGVKVAEQTGILKGLLGPEKKKQAIAVAEKFLADKGINLDLDKLGDLIEAEVQTQFSKPTPPADSPEARQQLIDSALHAAVLAAEQSGLTGLIQNIGPEKKAYAAGMALKYLDQYGIKVDPQLLGGLIESHLLESVKAGQASVQAGPAASTPPAALPPAYVPPVATAPPVYVPPVAPAPTASAVIPIMRPGTAPLPPAPPPPPAASSHVWEQEGPAG